ARGAWRAAAAHRALARSCVPSYAWPCAIPTSGVFIIATHLRRLGRIGSGLENRVDLPEKVPESTPRRLRASAQRIIKFARGAPKNRICHVFLLRIPARIS